MIVNLEPVIVVRYEYGDDHPYFHSYNKTPTDTLTIMVLDSTEFVVYGIETFVDINRRRTQ